MQPMVLSVNTPKVSSVQNMQKIDQRKTNDPFSSVLSKTQDKQENPKNDKVTSGDNKNGSKTNSVEEATQAAKNQVSKSVATKENSGIEEDISQDTSEVEEAVMEAVANLLQITPDELEQLLASLQIGLTDLLQGDNLQQLLMEVHQVDEPMDLLLIPEVTAQMKAINTLVEEHVANNLAKVFSTVDTHQELEVTVDENIQGLSAGSHNNAQTNEKEGLNNKTKIVDENTSPLEVTEVSTSKSSPAPVENDGELWQNHEGSTPNQNPSSHQFLETLSQSLGEAFQVQAEQVQEVEPSRYESINPRMVLDQIVEKIKVSALNEEAQMTIQLKPEHLGKLSMEVISKQGVMTAQFTVENEKTKAMLEQNIQNLKETLESKGLVIEQLEVTVGQNQHQDRQAYKSTRSNRDISNMINRMMNEDVPEEVQLEKPDKNETSEVDYIA